ncbi:hypothetical protein JCM6882_007843 [Rhodosporidiobolus microsporus]
MRTSFLACLAFAAAVTAAPTSSFDSLIARTQAAADANSTKGSNVSYPVTLGGVNLLSASAKVIADALDAGKFSSADLVEAYLQRIKANDRQGLNLKAIIETAPRDNILAIAAKLDAERAAGNKRSPIHGLPIAVKDNYNTAPELGMNTTAGSYALLGQTTVGDAFVIDELRKAGAIILAKANLHEFAGEMGRHNSSAFSARGGQVSSPYVEGGFAAGGDPGGSSSGSGAAVSAGFAALALGTDTEGSIVNPSNRGALYGLRPSTGLTSRTGVVPISSSQDTTGPMGRSAWDVAAFLEVMAAKSDPLDRLSAAADPYRKDNYTQYLLGAEGLKGLRIGIPREYQWNQTYNGLPDYMMSTLNDTLTTLASAGATIVDPVLYHDAEQLKYTFPAGALPVNNATRRLLTDFKADLGSYLTTQLVNSTVTSLFDVINFNNLNPELEFPLDLPDQFGQSTMIGSQAMQAPEVSPEYQLAQREMQRLYIEQIAPVFEEYDLDLILVPSEGDATRLCVIGQQPCGNVPAGQRPNGLPYGMTFTGRRYQEGTVIRAMSGWEEISEARPVPSLLD